MTTAVINGQTSDGYHTFDELYEHRCTLFIALCREIARANLGTLIQQRERAVDECGQARAEVERLRAIAQRIADAAEHCRRCRECGEGPCCGGCDVSAACEALAAESKVEGDG